MVKPKTEPQRRDGEQSAPKQRGELTPELREDLRALIARRAPALRELEKH